MRQFLNSQLKQGVKDSRHRGCLIDTLDTVKAALWVYMRNLQIGTIHKATHIC